MGQYITIIYTDEKFEIDNKIPHFRENGHLIIPYNNEIRYAVEELQKIGKVGMTLDELFNFYIDTEYILNEDKNNFLEEYKGLKNDINDLENIALVEFLKLLNLPDFTVLSYDDLVGDYVLNFENFIYKNSDRDFNRLKIRMDKQYLYSYDGCKMHCLKVMEDRRNNFNK